MYKLTSIETEVDRNIGECIIGYPWTLKPSSHWPVMDLFFSFELNEIRMRESSVLGSSQTGCMIMRGKGVNYLISNYLNWQDRDLWSVSQQNIDYRRVITHESTLIQEWNNNDNYITTTTCPPPPLSPGSDLKCITLTSLYTRILIIQCSGSVQGTGEIDMGLCLQSWWPRAGLAGHIKDLPGQVRRENHVERPSWWRVEGHVFQCHYWWWTC